jgi:hypothetical protein
MIRSTLIPIALASLLAAGGPAAQDNAAAKPGADAQTKVTTTAGAGASATADADLAARRKDMEERAAKVSVAAREHAQTELESSAKRVDDAATHGEAEVSARLGGDLDMSAAALTAERTQLDASWGQLMIAHELAANAKTTTSVADLIALHAGGMGWGEIAAGMGFDLGSVVRGVHAESRVATGEAKGSGHMAVLHGEGARAGLDAGAHLGAGVGHAKVGAGLGAGARVHVGH